MQPRRHNYPHPPLARGFTLIEVAVALLVLAVGVLGIAGLQTGGMQATPKTQQRATAMLQAEDLADRMRANIAGFRAMNYTDTLSGGTGTTADPYTYDASFPTSQPSPDCSSAGNTCDASQLALADLYTWQTQNAALLPSGQGEMTCADLDSSGTPTLLDSGSSCLITVRWDGNRKGATGTGCDPNDSSDLTCLRMRLTL
jgi:type IV pilus assembly protein PilV